MKTTLNITFVYAITLLFLSACTTPIATPEKNATSIKNTSLDGEALFNKTFLAHGGAYLDNLHDFNLAISGEWESLIKRIQPLVTDHRYRIDSEERILLRTPAYSSLYTGPAGNKKVVRTRDSISVFYNDNETKEAETLSATALTADAFPTFLLGPLALKSWANEFTRLDDIKAKGKTYHRLHLYKKPGFGFSEEDQVVLWIDSESHLTQRVQITLEGHSTTKGAYVETEYLDYITLDKYTLPTRFYERVKAPIPIGAHAWHYIGLDINRGLTFDDIKGKGYSEKALMPAANLSK